MEDSEKNKLLAQNEIQEIQRQANGWNFNKPVNPYRKFFQEVVALKSRYFHQKLYRGMLSRLRHSRSFNCAQGKFIMQLNLKFNEFSQP